VIRSLRYRLLIGASLCSAVVLALLGVSVYGAMRHALVTEFDSSLHADARLLTTMVDLDNGEADFDFRPDQMPEYESKHHKRYFEVWRGDGKLMFRSRSLVEHDLPQLPPTTGEMATEIQLHNSRLGRAVSVSYTPRARGRDERRPIEVRSVNIVVAAAPIEVGNTLRKLGRMLTILCTTAVLLMGAVLLHVVGRGVRPIDHLANEIGSMKETDLTRRLPHDGVPTELTPMVDKLNGLLARLEAAFAREKSFTADVAHELRTPLTGLRMTLEVCRSRVREPAAYEAAIDECRGITDRMEAMVESLLLLARSDAGQVTVASQEVDLCQLVSQNWEQVQYRAQRLGLDVSFDMPESLPVSTDPEKLAIVLRNVMDNAVSYVDPMGKVRIVVAAGENQGIVEIANTGSQIATEDAPRLFERFWRGDSARSEANVHCGLGLSLCQRLMKLLGGEIDVETAKGGDFVVRLKLNRPSSEPTVPDSMDASAPSEALV
jgi:two-component system sensor histidine kinase QseC